MRRPIAHRPNTDEEERRTQRDLAASDVVAFEDSDDALAACEVLRGQRWNAYPQYMGVWDRWVVQAGRKSWPVGKVRMLRQDGRVR